MADTKMPSLLIALGKAKKPRAEAEETSSDETESDDETLGAALLEALEGKDAREVGKALRMAVQACGD